MLRENVSPVATPMVLGRMFDSTRRTRIHSAYSADSSNRMNRSDRTMRSEGGKVGIRPAAIPIVAGCFIMSDNTTR